MYPAKYIIIFLCYALSGSLSAQVSFMFTPESIYNQSSDEAIEIEPSIYLVNTAYRTESGTVSTIYKIDNMGQVLAMHTNSIDSFNVLVKDIYYRNDTIYLVGHVRHIDTNQGYIVVFKLDEAFELLDYRIISIGDLVFEPYYIVTELINGVVYWAFNVDTTIPNHYFSAIIGKLNIEDYTILSRSDTLLQAVINDIMPIDDSIYFYGNGNFHITDANLSEINTKLSNHALDLPILQQGTFELVNDHIILTGKTWKDSLQSVIIAKVSKDFEQLDTLRLFENLFAVRSVPSFYQSLSRCALDNTSLFASGTMDWDLGYDPFSPDNARMFVAKLTGDGDTVWTRIYGGDAYYIPFGHISTSDGGILLYGRKYDHDNGPLKAFAIKIDSVGCMTSSTTLPSTEETLMTVYPNPAQAYLNIDIPTQQVVTSCDIYSPEGKLLLTGQLPRIAVGNLAAGSYVVRVRLKDRVIVRKFVKQ
ncbi:MAG: T9SS type A sorting domain-containing protein [Saprospiraceae bacterium]